MGLTGGIGSGKSTVAERFARLGAVVIDADVVAREVVAGGTPGFDAVVARFGKSVVGPDGELDRAALASEVFDDATARSDLNAIVHPLVGRRSAYLIAAAPRGAVIVYDVPLLAESGMAPNFEKIVVVEASIDTRLYRLAGRGMAPDQARARMRAQATDDERRAIADYVIDNEGDPEHTAEQVSTIWAELQSLTARADPAA